jgi:hypothetical protein
MMPTYLVTYRNGRKQRFQADSREQAVQFAHAHARDMSKHGQPSDDWRLGNVQPMQRPFPKSDVGPRQPLTGREQAGFDPATGPRRSR